MNLYLAMSPTMYRWFTPQQMEQPMNQLAFTDLLQYIAETAVELESDLDVIGPAAYLSSLGIPRETIDRFVQVCFNEIRAFYMNNSTPEWRAWGRHRVNVDKQYNIFVQLGSDPYV